MWDDLTYPGAAGPSGVIESGMSERTRRVIADEAQGIARSLKTIDRDLLGDCGYATAAWVTALSRAGVGMRKVGGFGQHVETLPPTPPDLQTGYWTTDDGLVQHWWLMAEEDGRIFDPTAHQFDDRGGVAIERYRVDGRPIAEWRLGWPDRAERFANAPQPDLVTRLRRGAG